MKKSKHLNELSIEFETLDNSIVGRASINNLIFAKVVFIKQGNTVKLSNIRAFKTVGTFSFIEKIKSYLQPYAINFGIESIETKLLHHSIKHIKELGFSEVFGKIEGKNSQKQANWYKKAGFFVDPELNFFKMVLAPNP